ncbi:TMEM175 family protein [Nonomuraea sp. 3-1Str]|uniref:TMEM175 family protein n=1 Tax=Nonomuraea sp. 3-1Str TaxID=2929801 RepID=UPI00285689A7|nr:TMEM175 family protein [Nonomuraea sp. 3-1Str]MDR8412001.1 TMEM175 family protein [Nonomuraea sp. 3-1Str]
MGEGDAVAPGMTHERVAMFVDAVFAIAMTLLAVEIPRPPANVAEGEGSRLARAARLWDFLGDNWSTWLAFVIAFLILWGVWREHHRTLDMVVRVSPRIMARHVPLLIVVVLLPYATGLIGESAGNPLTVCLFAGAVAALLFAQAALLRAILRDQVLRPDADAAAMRVEAATLMVVGAFWLLTAGLTWLVDGVPLLWVLSPVVGSVSGRRFAARA